MHSLLIKTKDNKILLKDAGSKFGSLILLQAKKMLINNKILSLQIGKIYLNLCICYYNYNCLYKIINYIVDLFCRRKNKKNNNNKKVESNNLSYNNRSKNDYLNDSNLNMIHINNYLFLNDNNKLDYNTFNARNIIIEDLIDIKYQMNKYINNFLKNKNNIINQYDKEIEVDKFKKNISVESFNNLNMAQ
jgi:hypothetical protein